MRHYSRFHSKTIGHKNVQLFELFPSEAQVTRMTVSQQQQPKEYEKRNAVICTESKKNSKRFITRHVNQSIAKLTKSIMNKTATESREFVTQKGNVRYIQPIIDHQLRYFQSYNYLRFSVRPPVGGIVGFTATHLLLYSSRWDWSSSNRRVLGKKQLKVLITRWSY